MGDELDYLTVLKGYLENHEADRRKRARERPGATKSTMATLLYDPGAPETDEQRTLREIVAFDSNIRDLNHAGIKTASVSLWLLARVGVLEVQQARRRWELRAIVAVVAITAFLAGVAASIGTYAIVW
jgi:hypothetical protein